MAQQSYPGMVEEHLPSGETVPQMPQKYLQGSRLQSKYNDENKQTGKTASGRGMDKSR